MNDTTGTMLRRGLGRVLLARRQRAIAAASGGGAGQQQYAPAAAASLALLQQARGFRHHEGGWWEDHDEGGIVAAEPVERNPEVYRSLLSYVTDARKEEIYRLHKLDPQVYDAGVLSYLFNLSRVRVEAIIRLKASEVEARLQGHLYTEEDDLFDAEAGSSSALPLAPGAPKASGKKQKGAAGSTDPGSLLLLDDENGRETMEDLSKPPSSAAAGEGSKLLAVMAAGAEMEVLKRLGLEGTAEGDAALAPWRAKIDESYLDELGAALEAKAVEARQAQEHAMYELVQPYEEKASLDEVPDPGSGFRLIEKRKQAVLADPLFLQHHVWMGLEKERLELLTAHVKAQSHRAGSHHAMTPYEEQELELAVQAYAQKKSRALEIFARLRTLRNEAAAKASAAAGGDEKKEGEEGKEEEGAGEGDAQAKEEERALLKAAKTELGARIVDPSEIAQAQTELLRAVGQLSAYTRRATLVKALRAPEGSPERAAGLREYMAQLQQQARTETHAVAGREGLLDHVRFEALQQHRRLLRQDAAGVALYGEVGDELAHAQLEQEVIAALDAVTEAEAAAAKQDGADYDERQRAALKGLLAATGPEGRAAAAKAYAGALLSEFSWEAGQGQGKQGKQEEEEVAKRALCTLLRDAQEASALRGKVDASGVIGVLMAEGAGAGAASLPLLQRALQLTTAAAGQNKDASEGLHARERGYQATVRTHLRQLQTQRKAALGKALASSSSPGGPRDPAALRRYLLLLAVAANVEAFDRLNQAVLAGVLPQLQRVFRHKPDVVGAAYGMLVDHLYGGKDVGSEALGELAKMASRTEAWVEATLLKLLEAHTAADKDDGKLPNPILVVANWLSHDCYASGVRSPAALKRLRAEMAAAVAGDASIGEAELQAVEEAAGGLGLGDAEEAGLILQEALALPIGAHADGDLETYEALRAGEAAPMEERARAAKALLEYLRQADAYHAYTGPVKDTVVGEIEEEIRDTIYEWSDDLRLDLDPNLVDLKPREHYDVPSLRFRVLNEGEAAVSLSQRDGFVEEEGEGLGQGQGRARKAWRPEALIPDPSATTKTQKGKATGAGLPQRRWSFAFKDTALGGAKAGSSAVGGPAGASVGATVVRDARTGRLRAASASEEGRRSWTKRRGGLPLKESA